MVNPEHTLEDDPAPPVHTGPERRSGLEQRQSKDPQPPPGEPERRKYVRRKADRIALEGRATSGVSGPTGRLYRRVRLEFPVIYRPLRPDFRPDQAARRGRTLDIAPGGMGMLLEEELPVGTAMEVLIRFEADILAADVEIVGVSLHGKDFLHNCRFTRVGVADRKWLTEYLRGREARVPSREGQVPPV